MKALFVSLVVAAFASLGVGKDTSILGELAVDQALLKVKVESQPELPNTLDKERSTSTESVSSQVVPDANLVAAVDDKLFAESPKMVAREVRDLQQALIDTRRDFDVYRSTTALLVEAMKSQIAELRKSAATVDVVAAVGPSEKPVVEYKNGTCSIVRRHETPTEQVVTLQSDGDQVQMAGPIRSAARKFGDAVKAVGWRITHPFGGRFRCK